MFSNQDDNKWIDKVQFDFHSERFLRFFFDKGIIFLSFKIDCSSFYWYEKPLSDADFLKEAKGLVTLILNKNYCLDRISLVEFAFLSIKKNSNSNGYSVYILLGYRPLFEFNESVLYRLKGTIFSDIDWEVVFIEHLDSYDKVNNFFKFMVSDINRIYDLSNFYIRSFRRNKNAYIHAEFEDFLYNEVASLPSFEPFLESQNLYAIHGWGNNKDAHIEGLNLRILQDRSAILLNLIRIFMQEHKMFLHNGVIFQIWGENSFIKKVIELDNFFLISEEIVGFLFHRFPYQLEPSTLRTLFLEYSFSFINKVKLFPSLLPVYSQINYLFEPVDLTNLLESVTQDFSGTFEGWGKFDNDRNFIKF